MSVDPLKRYCADGWAIALMKKDGLGWGHDLECGCFDAPLIPPRQGRIAKFIQKLKKGV